MTLREFLNYCSNGQKFLLEEQIYKENGDVKGWVLYDGSFYSDTTKRKTKIDYFPSKDENSEFIGEKRIEWDKMQDLLNYRVISVHAIAYQLLSITIDNKFELGE